MKKPLTERQVEKIINSWIGNGGRTRLWSICRKYKLSINEVYVILRMSPKVALKHAAKGKSFIAFEGA